MSNTVPCPSLGNVLLSTWNLNDIGISPGLEIQGNMIASPVAPLGSVWLTAATTSEVANDHSLVVNLDPRANLWRLWDLDTRLGTATGLGAPFLAQDSGASWAANAEPVVHVLDPVASGQWTWTLPVDPIATSFAASPLCRTGR